MYHSPDLGRHVTEGQRTKTQHSTTVSTTNTIPHQWRMGHWVPLAMIGRLLPHPASHLSSIVSEVTPKSAHAVQTFASEQHASVLKGLDNSRLLSSSSKTRSNQEGFSVTLLGGKGLKEPHDFSLLQRLLQLSTFPSSSSSHELSESPQDLDQPGVSITLHMIDPDFP